MYNYKNWSPYVYVYSGYILSEDCVICKGGLW